MRSRPVFMVFLCAAFFLLAEAAAQAPAREFALKSESPKFWELIDEILNAILFLLIGLEIIVIPFSFTLLWIGLIMIVIVLFARLISVMVPTYFLSFRRSFEKNMVSILTWGGLRGGISVALALSLPASMYRKEFVAITVVKICDENNLSCY